MRSRDSGSVHTQLGAFLAANARRVHSADVGALLGQAAWLSECSTFDEPEPAGWHDMMNAALGDAGRGELPQRGPGATTSPGAASHEERLPPAPSQHGGPGGATH